MALILDAELIRKLRSGDHEAWRKFFVAYHPVFQRALRTALRRMGDPRPPRATADPQTTIADAMAHFCEVFTKGFHTFQGEGRLRAYLFHTVHHFLLQTRDRLHREQRQGARAPGGDGIDAALEEQAVHSWQRHRATESSEDIAFLRECLQTLGGASWDVVNLYHFGADPVSLKTLAQRLGESYESVRKRYQRALAQLQGCVDHKRHSAEDLHRVP